MLCPSSVAPPLPRPAQTDRCSSLHAAISRPCQRHTSGDGDYGTYPRTEGCVMRQPSLVSLIWQLACRMSFLSAGYERLRLLCRRRASASRRFAPTSPPRIHSTVGDIRCQCLAVVSPGLSSRERGAPLPLPHPMWARAGPSPHPRRFVVEGGWGPGPRTPVPVHRGRPLEGDLERFGDASAVRGRLVAHRALVDREHSARAHHHLPLDDHGVHVRGLRGVDEE